MNYFERRANDHKAARKNVAHEASHLAPCIRLESHVLGFTRFRCPLSGEDHPQQV